MKIKSINISTRELEETERFYSDILELVLVYKSEQELQYQIGSSILKFSVTTTQTAPYHFAFNIPNSLLDSAVLWASQRFELIHSPANEIITVFENWKARSIYFYDNNGNLLEFIARDELEDDLIGFTFDSSKIDCISEIGIVTDSPIDLAENWISRYGLSYFKKSPPTEEFLALGDDHGLLILVSPNRNWYPTSQKAQKTNGFIEVEHHERTILLEIYTNASIE